MRCPRCKIGIIEGGTGCLICKFCHSIFDFDLKYKYRYKREEERFDEC